MSNNYRYEIVIYWSEDENAYIAEAPELPGCAAQGDSYAQALASLEIVISQWIEIATGLGRQIPEPRGRLIFA